MHERIAVDPRIHFGKPCIRGTRIPVAAVLELVREGIAFPQIISDYYSDLTTEDVQACVQHALDVVNLEEIHVAAAT